MKRFSYLQAFLFFLSLGSVRAETLAIDPAHSVMTIRVFKSGLFSGFAHNHEIEARGLEGQVSTTDRQQVNLRIDARKIKVLDPGVSADDRSEIQQTMEGPKVLDISRFPDIRFQSTSVVEKGPSLWEVSGNLTLHGQTRPVTVRVQGKGPRYSGRATVAQRDFGMQPISLFGGTVKVKNEVQIEFDIQTAAGPGIAQAVNGETK